MSGAAGDYPGRQKKAGHALGTLRPVARDTKSDQRRLRLS